MLKFKIEQIALHPKDPAAAIELLTAMGAGEWARDHVHARGYVGKLGNRYTHNETDAAIENDLLTKAKELEILHYTQGTAWIDDEYRVACLGMYCEMEEMYKWRAFFKRRGIKVAQAAETLTHTNPNIRGIRSYHYVIFDTFEILSVDIKLIVRINLRAKP